MSIEDTDSALQIVEAGRARVHVRLREAIEDQLQTRPDVGVLDEETIEALVQDAADRAAGSLWRISLAEGAADLYGVSVRDALADPALAAAEQLIGVDMETWSEPWEEWAQTEPEPEPVVPEPEPEPVVPEPEPEPVVPEPEPQPVVPEPEPEPVVPEPAPSVPEPEPATVPEPSGLLVPVVHRGGIDSITPGDGDIELRLSDVGLDVLTRSSGRALGRLDWNVITGIEVVTPKRRRKRKPRTLAVHTAGGDATFELSDLTAEQIDSELEPELARLRAAGYLQS